MLVRFVTSNFLSFDEDVELSLIPGRTRKHRDHIVRDPAWNGIDLLRIAVIYGANASGKSNLVRAMDFARNLIVEGLKPKQSIPVKCHKLKKKCANSPSKFEFEFKRNNSYYLYGFELDVNIIHTEWLYKTTSKSQKLIYERKTTNDGEVLVNFGDLKFSDKKYREFINFVARGTRTNQLFLTESIQRNVKQFEEVFSWFDDVLKIVFPESKYMGKEFLPGTNYEISSSIINYLKQFDAGIENITFNHATFETDLGDMPDNAKRNILSDLKPGETVIVHTPEKQRFIIRMGKNNEIKIFRLMSIHKIKDTSEPVLFDIDYESDGTLRMLDLIPALITMSETPAVFVIDELDRSLHPNLSKRLIQQFLSLKPQQNSQMIVTTHESNTLDLNVLRRDEIWFTEKDESGATNLFSLEEFAPRYDKDIRKGYLLGRFGAIPLLGRMRI